MKVPSMLASEPSKVLGSLSLVREVTGADWVLGSARVLVSSAIAAARSPPISLGSSTVSGSGSAAEGALTEGSMVNGLLEGFSGDAGALPSAWAQVKGMSKASQ